jgi:hypothetical protein
MNKKRKKGNKMSLNRSKYHTNILDCSGVRASPFLQMTYSLKRVTIPFCKLVGSPCCLRWGSMEWGKSGRGPAGRVTVSVAIKPVLAKSSSQYFSKYLQKWEKMLYILKRYKHLFIVNSEYN